MQSQIYLNFAEAMPIDGGAQVAPLQLCTIPVYKFCFFPHFPHFPPFPDIPAIPFDDTTYDLFSFHVLIVL